MASLSVWAAVALGALQGVLEWLPVSSEGNVTLLLTLGFGLSAVDAVGLSLFLHGGTAVAATVYYRGTVADLLRTVPDWRPSSAFDRDTAELSFVVVATLASGLVGAAAYATLESLVSAFTGGGFVAAVGLLLIATGLFQRRAAGESSPAGAATGTGSGSAPSGFGARERPRLSDAVLAGALQGLAILPGVSRSGVTTGALLLRGHDGPAAFRLSFLLSIPAALAAGALAVVEAGGLPSVAPAAAFAALATSAVVGFLTVGALLRVVERVAFWAVCLGLGLVAVLGAGLLLL